MGYYAYTKGSNISSERSNYIPVSILIARVYKLGTIVYWSYEGYYKHSYWHANLHPLACHSRHVIDIAYCQFIHTVWVGNVVLDRNLHPQLFDHSMHIPGNKARMVKTLWLCIDTLECSDTCFLCCRKHTRNRGIRLLTRSKQWMQVPRNRCILSHKIQNNQLTNDAWIAENDR